MAAVQKVLDAAVADPVGPAGLVFSAVDRNGKVLALSASGKKQIGSEDDMTPDTLFALYSCSKLITGIALMILVERGQVGLDDPAIVEKLLPEVANAKMADGSERKGKPITLRMLLTHTAGFGYTFFHEGVKKWSDANGGLDEFGGNIEGIVSPLIAQPGSTWNYGVNVDWAGELLHRLTGKTLGQFCREEIFDPLGCETIAFGLREGLDPKRIARFNQRPKPGEKLIPREHLEFTQKALRGEKTFDSGGAGCIGTISDYLKVCVILMNDGVGGNGKRILKSETIKEMLKDQLTHLPPVKVEGGKEVHALDVPIKDVDPDLTYPVDIMPGVNKGWGITFLITKDPLPTGRSANSVWWAGLSNNFWMVDPVKGVANMILSQSFPFNDPPVLGAWLGAEKAVYDAL